MRPRKHYIGVAYRINVIPAAAGSGTILYPDFQARCQAANSEGRIR